MKPVLTAAFLALFPLFAGGAESSELNSFSLTVPGMLKPVPVWVAVPPSIGITEKVPMILVLPPGSGTRDAVHRTYRRHWKEEAEKRRILVAIPEMHAVQLGRRARRVIPSMLGNLSRRYPLDKDRVVVAGASNGGIGAAAFFLQDPERFRALITLPGGPMRDMDVPRTVAHKPVFLAVGENDREWLQATEALRRYLEAAGADVTYRVLPGQGHALSLPAEDLFGWIEKAWAR